MFSVAIVGHSLTPTSVSVTEVDIQVFRKPGAKWVDLDASEFQGFWNNNFDLVIFILGDNDLTVSSSCSVIERVKQVVVRASKNCRNVRVFSAEKRSHASGNRFGVSNEVYNRQRSFYNRKLRRELCKLNVRVWILAYRG